MFGVLHNLSGAGLNNKLFSLYGPIVRLGGVVRRDPLILLADAESASKTLVAFAHQYMANLEQHYPRPQEYLPERWLADKDDPLSYKHANPFAYSVFGFGVRICIGRRIAELEMETFLAQLVQNFQVEWFGPPPRVEQTSLNYIKGPFNFIFNDVTK